MTGPTAQLYIPGSPETVLHKLYNVVNAFGSGVGEPIFDVRQDLLAPVFKHFAEALDLF